MSRLHAISRHNYSRTAGLAQSDDFFCESSFFATDSRFERNVRCVSSVLECRPVFSPRIDVPGSWLKNWRAGRATRMKGVRNVWGDREAR
jgi:hypothetical protein